MNISELLQSEQTLLLVKPSDLEDFANKIASSVLLSQPKKPDKPEPERPISQPEAIVFLGRSRQTLVKWRRKGIITAYKISGRIYFRRSELEAAFQKLGK